MSALHHVRVIEMSAVYHSSQDPGRHAAMHVVQYSKHKVSQSFL